MATTLELRAATETAVRAFRDGLVAGLAVAPGPIPLAPHIGNYRASHSGDVFSRLLRGPHLTAKLTVADYAWNGRAAFWVSVGPDAAGALAVSAAMNGFGIMEGHVGEASGADTSLAAVAHDLGRRAARWAIAERYTPERGWN